MESDTDVTVVEALVAWFLLSLTGALAPGPLSAAVIQNATTGGRAFGMLPMVGHAIVELVIVAAIVVSLQTIALTDQTVAMILLFGGSVVVLFGLLALRDYRISPDDEMSDPVSRSRVSLLAAITQGALVSILSPYFILWWFAIGLSTVTVLVVGIQAGVGALFIAGILVYVTHISTDLIYGAFLSLGTDRVRRHANIGGINWLNVGVGVFQIVLGALFICGAVSMLHAS